MKKPTIYWIDLFCGAGGTSTGIHLADENTKVIACVNHDANAILSHLKNHPDAVHYTEDIKDFAVVGKLKAQVDQLRASEPNCIIKIWASLECTNFSNAKGGEAKDPDSRSLAEHMYMYLEALKPDSFWVENVREFLKYGPLDENNKPIKELEGTFYDEWVQRIQSYGYLYDYKIMNSADYAACQKRKRLYIQFPKPKFGIDWPAPTHAKEPIAGLKKWNPVKNALDFTIQGNSIFNRKKPLSPKTIKRIMAGVQKFVPKGETTFTKQYNSGNDALRTGSINEPIGTVTTNNRFAIVETKSHLNTYYNHGGLHSINEPAPTVTTKDRIAKVDVNFIDNQYGNGFATSIESPVGALTTVPKFNIVKAEHFIFNPSWFGNEGSIDEPCYTIVARQDKAPLYLIRMENGLLQVPIYEGDCEATIELKKLMLQYNISDIKMRMLVIPELKLIQGFPENYELVGSQKDQKKYIGNAVEVNQAKAIVKCICNTVFNYYNQQN